MHYTESHFRRLLASGEYACFLGAGLAAQQRRDRHYDQVFLLFWLFATLVNMWVGVSKAGYSIKDEAQLLLLVFAVPAIVRLSSGGDPLLPKRNNLNVDLHFQKSLGVGAADR